jgi:hypothetical protein
MSFTLVTEDSVYSYSNSGVSGDQYTDQEYFKNTNNIKTANTQGFLIKVQKGDDRMTARVKLADSESNITTNLYPMLNYPSTLNVTFERSVPFRSTQTLKMEMVDLKILKEFPGQGIGGVDVLEIEISLIESIAV